MQEQINEKISLLMDDELDSDAALSLLSAIQIDDDLKGKLQRYQLMSQVLKNEDCLLLDNDFAEKIHQQIRQEPTYFIPSRQPKTNRRKLGLAIAASIMLAVVWIANKVDKQTNGFPEQQFASTLQEPLQADMMSDRFGEYLQAHDNDVYVNSNVRVQPYARVVGYHQE